MKTLSTYLLAALACFVSINSNVTHAQATDNLPVCSLAESDSDGDGYGWENEASCISPVVPTTQPQFTNPITGEPAVLTRAYWDASDFHTPLACNEVGPRNPTIDEVDYLVYHTPANPDTVGVRNLKLGEEFVADWSVINGVYSGPVDIGQWIEFYQVGDDVSLLLDDPTQRQGIISYIRDDPRHNYTLCYTIVPTVILQPTGTPQSTGQCLDLDGDGYGWDGTATCVLSDSAPIIDGNCDYSNASLYGGWGWDPIANQSCAPLDTNNNSQSASQCVDSDGDGWGWNGTTSCIP